MTTELVARKNKTFEDSFQSANFWKHSDSGKWMELLRLQLVFMFIYVLDFKRTIYCGLTYISTKFHLGLHFQKVAFNAIVIWSHGIFPFSLGNVAVMQNWICFFGWPFILSSANANSNWSAVSLPHSSPFYRHSVRQRNSVMGLDVKNGVWEILKHTLRGLQRLFSTLFATKLPIFSRHRGEDRAPEALLLLFKLKMLRSC